MGPSLSPEPIQSLSSYSPVQMSTLMLSINKAKQIISQYEWNTSGFKELENLGYTLQVVSFLTSNEEIFGQLNLLRAWMFWFDLSEYTQNRLLQEVTRAHFYAMVLAMIPYFPVQRSAGIYKVCIDWFRQIRDEMFVTAPRTNPELWELFWNVAVFA